MIWLTEKEFTKWKEGRTVFSYASAAVKVKVIEKKE